MPGRRFREYALIMADNLIDGFAHLVTLVLGQVDIFTAFIKRKNLYNIPRPNLAAVCKSKNVAYTFQIKFHVKF